MGNSMASSMAHHEVEGVAEDSMGHLLVSRLVSLLAHFFKQFNHFLNSQVECMEATIISTITREEVMVITVVMMTTTTLHRHPTDTTVAELVGVEIEEGSRGGVEEVVSTVRAVQGSIGIILVEATGTIETTVVEATTGIITAGEDSNLTEMVDTRGRVVLIDNVEFSLYIFLECVLI